MSRWLQSGRRRDLCYLLAADGELRGQELKTRLESRYGDRVEPKAFYGSLAALVAAGHVEERSDGVHDVYALSAVGERLLREHHEWVSSLLDDLDD